MKRRLYPTRIFFNKALLIFSFLALFHLNSFAQGPKWATLGNTISTGEFIGPTNFQSLVIKTNNITRGVFTATGSFQLSNLVGAGNRFLQTDALGNIIPFTMGTASDVLYGNGIWGALPTIPPLLWQQSGSDIYYNTGNVGIGMTPLFPLDINGDVRISNNLYVGGGIVISDKVNAISEVKSRVVKSDSIMTDSTKGFYGTTKFNGDVKLKFKLAVDGDAVLNGNAQVNGTLNASNISSNSLTTNNLAVANTFSAYRITGAPGDSVLRIGDSTLLVNFRHGNISISGPLGISIGGNGGGSYNTYALGVNSFAVGNNVRIGNTGINAVAIGSTSLAGTYFQNNTPNSMAVGFNSTIPTFFVTASSGAGTTGNVGIGTTNIPSGYKLAVNGKIITEEVNIKLYSAWPDYVLKKGYKLLPLPELELYINKNNHLPNFPPASEIEKNGINTSEIITQLVKSQEEQTKYILMLNAELKSLREELNNLKNK